MGTPAARRMQISLVGPLIKMQASLPGRGLLHLALELVVLRLPPLPRVPELFALAVLEAFELRAELAPQPDTLRYTDRVYTKHTVCVVFTLDLRLSWLSIEAKL